MSSYDGCMAVERSRWTDDRLDELAERVMRHDSFEVKIDHLQRSADEVRTEMRELRTEMRELGGELRTEMREIGGELRAEMHALRADLTSQVSSLRSELYDTRRWLMTMWLTGLLGLLGVFVEIALRT